MVALDHLNMTVRNVDESIEWYNKVFDFEVVEKKKHKGRNFAVLRSQDSMLCIYEYPELKKPETNTKTHKHYHYGLRIKDRQLWENKMAKENIEIDHTWQYPSSYSWYLFDPSGHEIEVVHWNDDKVQFTDDSQ